MINYVQKQNELNELKNLIKNYEYLDEAEKSLEEQKDILSENYKNILKKEKVYLFEEIIDKAELVYIPFLEQIKYVIENIDDDFEFTNALKDVGIKVNSFNIFFICSTDKLFCSYFPYNKLFKFSEKYSNDFFASFPVNIDLIKLENILENFMDRAS